MIIKKVHVILVAAIVIAGIFYVTKAFPDKGNPDRPDEILRITTTVKTEIDDAVQKSKLITGIHIVSVDFKKNIRIETYMSIDNVVLQNMYTMFIQDQAVKTPFFNNDKENNARMIRLIQGDFVCVPYKNSTAYKYAPSAETYVKYVCGLGIPPQHYNNFSGILTLYLTEVPAQQQLDQLFIFTRSLSIKIIEDNEDYNKLRME